MLIVLPPSEGKAAPPQGPPLDLDALSFPSLSPQRRRVLTALVRLCRADEQAAMSALGLGIRQAAEVGLNAGLRKAPTQPAIGVYSGVLYEALDAGSLDAASRRRLNRMVAISSALFGLLRPMDAIPAYRLSADARLPGLPSLALTWGTAVSAALDDTGGLVWDLRSAAYASLGPLPVTSKSTSTRVVISRVLLQRGGKRTVVSHHNKATKGRMVRAIVESGCKARTAEDLAGDLAGLGFGCELQVPTTGPARLDVIVTEV